MAECCSQQQDDSISLPIIERGAPSVAEAAMDEESEEKEEETCSSEEAADRAMPMRKIRPTPSSNDDAMGGETVGAIQINERAPQINRRFFFIAWVRVSIGYSIALDDKKVQASLTTAIKRYQNGIRKK